MKLYFTIGVLGLALGSCGPRHEPQRTGNNAPKPAGSPTPAPAVTNTEEAGPAQTAKKPAIDPKSTTAAVDLLKRFVGLLNQHEFDEAYMLLGPGAPTRAEFGRDFARYSDLKVAVGVPGDPEGAAGSIYLSVPLTVAGTDDRKHSIRSATAILRRINDVPGSTEAQRHWHIERIDWRSAG